jgi:hypothetical protein
MRATQRCNRTSGRFKITACSVALLTLGQAHAGTLDLGGGVQANWTLQASVSGTWRARSPDPDLIGVGDGGTGSGYSNGSAGRNFAKGDNTSTLLRLLGDVDLKYGEAGAFLRAKAWNDLRYSRQGVAFGAPSNNFVPDTRLRDDGFDTRLSRFSGVALLDAYGYAGFELAGNPVKVKLGSHVVNWGESLFVPGVNQSVRFDLTALHQPGTLLKEVLLPSRQLSINAALPGGLSAEAFYQFKWERSVLDGCGTFWSSTQPLNCVKGATLTASDATPFGPLPSALSWNGVPVAPGVLANFRLPLATDLEPDSPRTYGLALKKRVDALDTEFGFYYVNYAPHLPNLSAVRNTTAIPGSVYAGVGSAMWDYSAKDIKVAGLSASTEIGGWSVSGELSYTRDFPMQINGGDLLTAFAADAGPMATRIGATVAPFGSGMYLRGWDRKNKTQIQASTIKTFANVLGASNVTLVGEVAAQRWSGIGDPYSGVRYGRGFEYGVAQHATLGGACLAGNPADCTQDGYSTSNAWGWRAQVELEYPGLLGPINVKPRIFISQDVRGWSADGLFVQDRRAVALGARFEYLHKYSLDLSYSMFNRKARFDSLHDRDFIGLALSAAF